MMAPLYPIAGIIVGLIQLGAGAWGGVWGAQVACDLEGSLSGLGAASCFVEQTPLPLPTDVASPISTVTRIGQPSGRGAAPAQQSMTLTLPSPKALQAWPCQQLDVA
ncbi:hypothetical protein ABBQ38_007840 [Trebouxia sp. C0009 RCD-2024]